MENRIFSKKVRYWRLFPTILMGLFVYTYENLYISSIDVIGYSHNPYEIEKIAKKNGFEMENVRSSYYEYKYMPYCKKNRHRNRNFVNSWKFTGL